MSSNERLASLFLSNHPEVAARLLESMGSDEAAEVLQSAPANTAAAVIGHMLPTSSARCAEQLATETVAKLLEHLPNLTGAALLRHFPPATRDAVLERLSPALTAALRLLLHYPTSAVGAWMEPRVLTLPNDCDAGDAAEQLERAEHIHSKVYVLDRSRRVRGAVSGARLLRGTRRGPISALLDPIETLWARESVSAAQERDIWERESEAPVVNRQDEFVGVVSYTDLRKGHRQLLRPERADDQTQEIGELAELFLSGLDGAWQSLGEIIRSERPDGGRRP